MNASTHQDPERTAALQAMADAGRQQSTAMVLFHTNLSQRVGLSPTEEKVLELARRRDHPSVGDIAKNSGLAKNTISDVLDRLEDKGFVTRERHPSDGRKVAIVATEEGVGRIGRRFGSLMARLGALQSEYSTEELVLIAGYQRRAAEIQMEEAASLAGERD